MKSWMRFLRLVVAILVILVVPTIGLYLHKKARGNPYASCANCRTHMLWNLTLYTSAHGGWYPRGGKDPLDSLGKSVDDLSDVHFFTSHALYAKALKYWKAHRSLSKEVCCYRYNEGLRDDDPSELVLMYYYRPTHWECPEHKMGHLGRPVLRSPAMMGIGWRFLSEEEFQNAQAETLKYLEKRKARWKEMVAAESQLKLLVRRATSAATERRFLFQLGNRGGEPIRVRFLDGGSVADDVGVHLTDIGLGTEQEVVLKPGETRDLSGWLKVTVTETTRGDEYDYATTFEGSGGKSSTTRVSTRKGLKERAPSEWLQARLHVNVQMGAIGDLEVFLASDHVKYLVDAEAP